MEKIHETYGSLGGGATHHSMPLRAGWRVATYSERNTRVQSYLFFRFDSLDFFDPLLTGSENCKGGNSKGQISQPLISR